MFRVTRYLRPNRWTIFIWMLLWLIVIGGRIQSWAFAPPDVPKPIGYEAIRFLPLWPLAIMILLPLLALSSPLASPLMDKGIDITSLNTWYGILVVGVYLYVVASLCVAVVNHIFAKKAAS